MTEKTNAECRFQGPPWFPVLEALVADGLLDLRLAPWLQCYPALPPDWRILPERAEAMLLGLALGDALGAPTESMTPGERRQRYGEIRDLGVGREHKIDGRRHGVLTTDDSQLAFWTVEVLLKHRDFQADLLAFKFSNSGHIRGQGQTTRQARHNFRDRGLPWYRAGVTHHACSNGALMRIAPMLLPHLARPTRELWAETAIAAALTHNDAASTAACLAWVTILMELLTMDSPPEPTWWADRYVMAASQLEKNTYLVRGGEPAGFHGPLWQLVDQEVTPVALGEQSLDDALGRWYSGAYLLETVPCLLAICARQAHQPEEAILTAVNRTRDNDTIASLVATAMGALHGPAAFPSRWTESFDGRLSRDDPGRVQMLCHEAAHTFTTRR